MNLIPSPLSTLAILTILVGTACSGTDSGTGPDQVGGASAVGGATVNGGTCMSTTTTMFNAMPLAMLAVAQRYHPNIEVHWPRDEYRMGAILRHSCSAGQ